MVLVGDVRRWEIIASRVSAQWNHWFRSTREAIGGCLSQTQQMHRLRSISANLLRCWRVSSAMSATLSSAWFITRG